MSRPAATNDGPEIYLGVDEHRVVDEAIAALTRCSDIYYRGHLLVRVLSDDKKVPHLERMGSTPTIGELPSPTLKEWMSKHAAWFSHSKTDGWIPCHPPAWAVSATQSRARWPQFRSLAGITEAPILRPDGSILDVPGYDERTQMVYAPSADFGVIPERPTINDAKQAIGDLKSAVSDFPFADGADLSAWLAGLLTPFARRMFDGPTPLLAIDANCPGTGKSLLCDFISIVYSGRRMARGHYANDDAEMRKRITSYAIAGDPLIMLDNLNIPLGCAALDIVLTGTTWRDRILGKSEATQPNLPMTAFWVATGNNIAFTGDTPRRVLYCRLNANVEKPEERSGFRHPNLLEWATQERVGLVRACLTVLRSYVAAGHPIVGIKTWGSYEAWSEIVRASLVWTGEPDPMDARQQMAETDYQGNALATLIESIEQADHGLGVTAAELIKLSTSGNDFEPLHDALGELCPTRDGKAPSSVSLGRIMRSNRKRIIRGRYIDLKSSRNGTCLWCVRDAKEIAK